MVDAPVLLYITIDWAANVLSAGTNNSAREAHLVYFAAILLAVVARQKDAGETHLLQQGRGAVARGCVFSAARHGGVDHVEHGCCLFC